MNESARTEDHITPSTNPLSTVTAIRALNQGVDSHQLDNGETGHYILTMLTIAASTATHHRPGCTIIEAVTA